MQSGCHLTPTSSSIPPPPLLLFHPFSFAPYCHSSISVTAVQGASPVAKFHCLTTLGWPLTPHPPKQFNSFQFDSIQTPWSHEKGWTETEKEWLANKKNLCGLGVHSPSLFGPGRKNKPHISIFQPFLLFSFTLPHWSYLREQGQKERGERARGVDGEREGDIDITFIESPFTLPLLSLEKVRTRISSPLWDSLFAPPYPPPVAPLYKKKTGFFRFSTNFHIGCLCPLCPRFHNESLLPFSPHLL